MIWTLATAPPTLHSMYGRLYFYLKYVVSHVSTVPSIISDLATNMYIPQGFTVATGFERIYKDKIKIDTVSLPETGMPSLNM